MRARAFCHTAGGCYASQSHICYVYGMQSRSSDEWLFNNLNAVAIWAAGNAGDTPFRDQGARTVAAPALAKNIISVGATQNARFANRTCRGGVQCDPQNLALFSSRGPTFDERYKPDLVFVGEDVMSSRSSRNPDDGAEGNPNCEPNPLYDNALSSGTSMATPGVGGAAALIRQYLQVYNIRTGVRGSSIPDTMGPTGALVKAMLVHSAQVPTGVFRWAGPDGALEEVTKIREANDPRAQVGRGLINLRRVVRFEDDDPETKQLAIFPFDRYQLNRSGDSLSFVFRTLATNATLKVSLVYTDAPGPLVDTVGAQRGERVLINDLDLCATCSSATLCSFESKCDQGRVDNVAQVVDSQVTLEPLFVYANPSLDPFEPLQVTVTVRAEKISVGPQTFALVVSGVALEEESIPETNFRPSWASTAADDSTPTDGDDGSSNSLNLALIIGAAVGGLVLAVSVVVLFVVIGRRKNRNANNNSTTTNQDFY